MNDVGVHLGVDHGQRGVGNPGSKARMHFVHMFFVLNQERYTFCFVNIRNSSAWGRNYKIRLALAHSFDGGLPPPLFETDIIHAIKWPRLPSILHTASDQELDAGKA